VRTECATRQIREPVGLLRVRKAWEGKERVASGCLVLLKEAQARYAGRLVEALYRKVAPEGYRCDTEENATCGAS